MKQTLLILGDSFADTREGCPDYTGKSWTTLLEESNDYTVVNKAAGGSSLYYAYTQFNQLHEKFDKMMLVVTHPGRLYCPIIGGCSCSGAASHHSSIFSVERNKDRIKKHHPHNIAAIQQLDAIKDYFLYIQDYSKDQEMDLLMLDDIKRKRADIILVPAFRQSRYRPKQDPTSWLDQISDMEMKHYGITHDNLRTINGYYDCRKSHMSERNNQILYEKSLKWLKGDPVKFDVLEFEKPTEPREKYFPTIKDWEMRFSNK
jgi:hypothetical protein